MKKILALLMATAMILSLAACGDDKEVNSKNESKVTSSKDASGVAKGSSTIETKLWTLNYDSSVWTYAEDDFEDGEEQSKIILTIPDPEEEDSYILNAEIRVSIDDPYTFRGYLNSYGFDQYEYKVNNAYEFTKVGGVDCLMQEGNYWGDPCIRYFNRVEGAGATVFIEIIGDKEDTRINELLSGLTINLTDTGNVDGPWYWDGTPFSTEDKETLVGTHKLNTKWIAADESIITSETFKHNVAVVGDKVYMLNDGVLNQYSYDGKKLTFDKKIELEDEYDYIQATEDGFIWLSAHINPLISLKDGVQTASYDGTKYVTMDPSGKWGISWFTGSECEKITISDGALTSAALPLEGVDSISYIFIDDKYIYACGSAADDSGHKVFVYDKDGKLQKTLADADGEGLGSITFVTSTSNGFIGFDGNMRTVVLWNKDGAYIGEADDADLFGTSYPWFCASAKMKDGSIFTIMTEEREDKSADEVIAFCLSGF
ncbi:MAG: hypothetical protein PUC88_01320 [Clostridia bacterium]|nr:hypothetical protein [Clostridia bacterium]